MVDSNEISNEIAEVLQTKFKATLKHSDGFGDEIIDIYLINGKKFIIDICEDGK